MGARVGGVRGRRSGGVGGAKVRVGRGGGGGGFPAREERAGALGGALLRRGPRAHPRALPSLRHLLRGRRRPGLRLPPRRRLRLLRQDPGRLPFLLDRQGNFQILHFSNGMVTEK